MRETEKLLLKLPDYDDYVDIEVLNENWTKIDTLLGDYTGQPVFNITLKRKLENARLINEAKELTIGQNLNDIKKENYYFAKTKGVVNSPVDVGFSMLVVKHSGFNQILVSDDAEVYIRSFKGTAWQDWVKMVSGKDLESALKDIRDNIVEYKHPATHPASMITQDRTRRFVTDTQIAKWNGIADIKNAIEIKLNDDLNTYKDTGFYICKNRGTANSLYNTPIRDAFSMTVTKFDNQVVQVITAKDGLFMRYFVANWNAWDKIAVVSDVNAMDQALEDHLNAEMPHKWKNTDGSYTRYGFKAVNGNLEFVYKKEV